MLVLSRRVGEKIHIGSDIVLEIVEVDRGKVRIGIIAPKDVAIRRDDYEPKPPPKTAADIEGADTRKAGG